MTITKKVIWSLLGCLLVSCSPEGRGRFIDFETFPDLMATMGPLYERDGLLTLVENLDDGFDDLRLIRYRGFIRDLTDGYGFCPSDPSASPDPDYYLNENILGESVSAYLINDGTDLNDELIVSFVPFTGSDLLDEDITFTEKEQMVALMVADSAVLNINGGLEEERYDLAFHYLDRLLDMRRENR